MPADAVYQLVARLPSTTGLPEDTVENVFHVGLFGTAVDATKQAAMRAAVRDFYITIPSGQTVTVGSLIGDSISRTANACQVELYATTDLTGQTPMGSPLGATNFTLTSVTAGPAFPEEVATVISYNGDLTDVPVSEANPTPPPATIRPAQRRRGRTFVGPLMASVGSDPGAGIRPSTTWRTLQAVAFKAMANTINAIDPALEFGVWSRADADVYPAVGGWVDDAWDTQRRRGLAPTIRTTFFIP